MSINTPDTESIRTASVPVIIRSPSVVSIVVLSSSTGTSISTIFSEPGAPVPVTRSFPSVVSIVTLSSSIGTSILTMFSEPGVPEPLTKN